MEDNLMVLVDDCKSATFDFDEKAVQQLEKARDLRSLGFKAVADEMEDKLLFEVKKKKIIEGKYIQITNDAIIKFLKRKADRYNETHKKKKKKGSIVPNSMAEYRALLRQRMDQIANSAAFQPNQFIGLHEPQSGRAFHEQMQAQMMPMPSRNIIDLNIQRFNYEAARIGIRIENAVECNFDRAIELTIIGESPAIPIRVVFIKNLFADYHQLKNQIITGFFNRNPGYQTTSDFVRRGNAIGELMNGITNSFNRTDSKETILSQQTCDYRSTEEGTIGKYEWTETKVENYKGIPPKDVLEKLKEEKEKNIFDYFTIASVNAVKDPLLLGKVNEMDSRFFLRQWGTDITIDDLI